MTNNSYINMIRCKVYKVEIQPNNKQQSLLNQAFGVARFTYNWGLDKKEEAYKNKQKTPTSYDLSGQLIIIEDLNVSAMLKNHKLAKSISDSSFGEIRRQLEYKAKWYGRTIVHADRYFPSSKKCSNCGNVKDTLLLSDRDLNAAINLRNCVTQSSVTQSTAGFAGSNALGDVSSDLGIAVKCDTEMKLTSMIEEINRVVSDS